MDRPPRDDAPRVCMFVRNDYRFDGRAERAAATLERQGFETIVLAVTPDKEGTGWDHDDVSSVFRVQRPGFAPWLASLYDFLRPERKRRLREWKARYHEQRKRGVPNPREGIGPVPRIEVRGIWLTLHRFSQTWHFAKTMGSLAASLRPVAYHCHDLNSFLAGFVARLRHSAPIVYDSHEIWPHRNRPDGSRFKSWGLTQIDRIVAHLATAVIVVSGAYADHFWRRYARRTTVVRNIPPAAARAPVPAFANMDAIPRPRLLYVGKVAPHRGIEQTMEALPDIPNASFVLVGPGGAPFKEDLRRLAEQLGILERVHFIDLVPLDAVVPTIAQADVGTSIVQNVGLSHVSTLPNKVFEYLQAGLALVVSDFPEVRRVVEQHGVGVAVDPSDSKAIAAVIRGLLDDPARLEEFKRNALRAGHDLTWENEQQVLVALYRRILSPAQWPRRTVERARPVAVRASPPAAHPPATGPPG